MKKQNNFKRTIMLLAALLFSVMPVCALAAQTTLTVTVPSAVPTKIEVSGETSLMVNDTLQLTAKVEPENAASAKLFWSSSDTSVAQVDENGLVTGKGAGEAVITAASEDGSVQGSLQITAVYLLNAPETVKAVSQSYNTLKISWSKVSGAAGYRIYRADSLYGEYKAIYTTSDPNKLSVNNLNRVTGKPYYYKVCALGTHNGKTLDGKLSDAKAGRAVPSKPKNVKAESVSATTIKVSWNAVAGAKGYKLYASTSGKAGTYYLSYTTNNPDKLSVNVLNRATGKTYYFKVRAISEYNGTTISGTLSTAVKAKAIPSAPIVTISKASTTSIRNKWKSVYKADGYEVYRSTTGKSGSFYLQKRTPYLSYSNTKLTKGKTYYYKVRAYSIVNNKRVYGSFSPVKSIKL